MLGFPYNRYPGLTIHATVVTRDSGAIRRMASLTRFVISRPRDRGNALGRFKGSGIPKFDLRCPYSTGDVHPVVVCCAFQRLSRIHWPVQILLAFLVLLSSFTSLLHLKFLALTILVGHLLFVVGQLRLLDELVLCMFNWTQYAFVLLIIVSVKGLHNSTANL
jgi:hypothetical protein